MNTELVSHQHQPLPSHKKKSTIKTVLLYALSIKQSVSRTYSFSSMHANKAIPSLKLDLQKHKTDLSYV